MENLAIKSIVGKIQFKVTANGIKPLGYFLILTKICRSVYWSDPSVGKYNSETWHFSKVITNAKVGPWTMITSATFYKRSTNCWIHVLYTIVSSTNITTTHAKDHLHWICLQISGILAEFSVIKKQLNTCTKMFLPTKTIQAVRRHQTSFYVWRDCFCDNSHTVKSSIKNLPQNEPICNVINLTFWNHPVLIPACFYLSVQWYVSHFRN